MPNHIMNRLELVGNSQRVKELVAKFSTHYEPAPRTTDFDEVICKNDQGEYGWLNPKTGVFKRRNKPDADVMPEGFSPDIEPAWTLFPDFNKIVPMPAIMVGYNPCSNITTAIEAKYNIGLSNHPLLAIMQQQSREQVDFKFNAEQQAMFDRGCKIYEETGYIYWYDWACDKWGTKWNAYNCAKLADNVYEFQTAWRGIPKLIAKMAEEFPDVTIHYEYSDEDIGSNCGTYLFYDGKVVGGELENGGQEAYELAFKLRPHVQKYYILTEQGYECLEE